jgi:hypothetical protein
MDNFKTEEEIKTKMYNIFLDALNETSHVQKIALITELIKLTVRWCKEHLWPKDYLMKTDEKELLITEKMGLEIVKIFIIDKKSKKPTEGREIKIKIDYMPKEKDAFFKYLFIKLYHERKRMIIREKRKSKNDPIRIPRTYKEIRNYIIMKERIMNRELTVNEQIFYVSEWKRWPEKKTRAYLEEMNRIFISHYFSDEDDEENEEHDIFEKIKQDDNPRNLTVETEYFTNNNTEIIRNAIESALMNINTKDRECCRALFTLDCLKKIRDFEELVPVLDGGIIEAQKREEGITQVNIFKNYHPDITDDESASSMASRMLRNFRTELKKHLKNNNPEIFV